MNAKQNQRISNCEAESKDIGCMFNSRSIGPSYCDEPRETKCKEILLWYINCAVLQHCSILRHLWSQPAQHLRSQNVSSKRTDRRQPLLMLSCFFISIMCGTNSRAPNLCRLQTSEPGLHAVSWFAGWKAAKVLSSKKTSPMTCSSVVSRVCRFSNSYPGSVPCQHFPNSSTCPEYIKHT